MASRIPWAVAAALAAVAAVAGCTLIIGDLHECKSTGDCSDGRSCVQGYCVNPTPDGCRGLPDAGVQAVYGAIDAGDAIHFGAVLSLTDQYGVPSDVDVAELDALVLAVKEVNQRGIAGRQVALHVCAYASQSDRVPALTTYLTDVVGTPAIIVANSSGVFAAQTITQSRGVVIMSANATSTEITGLNNPDGGVRLVWRTAPSDAIQGRVINDLLLGAGVYDAGIAGKNPVGIAYVNDPYGQGLSGILLTGLTGTKNVAAFPFDRGGDITAVISGLLGMTPTPPKMTVVIGFPDDAAHIVTAAAGHPELQRSAGHQWFFTDAAKSPSIISNSPPGEVENALGTAPAKGAGPAYTVFRNSFSSQFGINADNYAFVENDYDALYVLALGSAFAAGSGTGEVTGSKIAEGLGHLETGATMQLGTLSFANAASTLQAGGSVNVEGASGHLDFDVATGEAPAPIELWTVDAGTIKGVTTIQ